MTYSFGPFQLDARSRRLTRGDWPISLRPIGALVEGRAALESMDREAVERAGRVFDQITKTVAGLCAGASRACPDAIAEEC
jgi:hypothetical protein